MFSLYCFVDMLLKCHVCCCGGGHDGGGGEGCYSLLLSLDMLVEVMMVVGVKDATACCCHSTCWWRFAVVPCHTQTVVLVISRRSRLSLLQLLQYSTDGWLSLVICIFGCFAKLVFGCIVKIIQNMDMGGD